MKSLKELYKVDKNGCWIFQLYIGTQGYGQINRNGKSQKAHRYFYETLVGKIPTGLEIDHLCRVRSCVNSKHLRCVTKKVNILCGISPSAIHARQKFCQNGHRFTKKNTYIKVNGWRECRTCKSKKQRNSEFFNRTKKANF